MYDRSLHKQILVARLERLHLAYRDHMLIRDFTINCTYNWTINCFNQVSVTSWRDLGCRKTRWTLQEGEKDSKILHSNLCRLLFHDSYRPYKSIYLRLLVQQGMRDYVRRWVYERHCHNDHLLPSCLQALQNLTKAMLLPLPKVQNDLHHPVSFCRNLNLIQSNR